MTLDVVPPSFKRVQAEIHKKAFEKNISRLVTLRNTYSGSCVVMGNGPSLLDYDLTKIPIPIIGTNQSWRLIPPTIHHCVEFIHFLKDQEVYSRLASEGKLITSGFAWISPWPLQGCITIPIRTPSDSDPVTFSFDLTKGVICTPVEGLGVGTVVYSALQLAIWLGFREIYLMGVDLYGPKFTGEEAGEASGNLAKMDQVFHAAKKALYFTNVKVTTVGLGSHCTAFPKVDFPW